MRMKLLEARSRELELKFKKNSSPSTPNSAPSVEKSSTGTPSSTLARETTAIRDQTPLSNAKPATPDLTPEQAPVQPIDSLDHQGPRTPPDNHVVTLEDEQIEWPSHLIKMTTAQPSIPYSINPGSIVDYRKDVKKISPIKRRSSTSSSNWQKNRKKHKDDGKNSSLSPPSNEKVIESISSPYKYSALTESDLDSDFAWFLNYFIDSFGMDLNQAQHQSYSAIISGHTYDPVVLEKWLNSRGYTKFKPSKHSPKYTMIKSQKEIVLPNGHILPPGTIEKVVHPYPKMDSHLLGPYYDLY